MAKEKGICIVNYFVVITAGLLFAAGLAQLGNGLMIPAKAWLASYLINQAWAHTLDGEEYARPWPWMDSAPVAKVDVPRLNKHFVVMRGTSGTVLAFTPGWHEGTAFPGEQGISLISAHRDTHFGFLRDMTKGDEIVLHTTEDEAVTYIVDELKILEESEIKVPAGETEKVLLLSTCFPFSNWRPGGEMRFVVVAKALNDEAGATS